MSYLCVSYILTQFKVLGKVFGIRIRFTGSKNYRRAYNRRIVCLEYQVYLWNGITDRSSSSRSKRKIEDLKLLSFC